MRSIQTQVQKIRIYHGTNTGGNWCGDATILGTEILPGYFSFNQTQEESVLKSLQDGQEEGYFGHHDEYRWFLLLSGNNAQNYPSKNIS